MDRIRNMVDAVAMARRINRALWPRPGQALFYSGERRVPEKKDKEHVRRYAKRYALERGLKLSSQLLSNVGIIIPHQTVNRYSNRLWRLASILFSKRASGKVQAIVGDLRRGSIYKNIELPLLRRNPKVTQVVEIDVRNVPPTKSVVHEKPPPT